MNELARIADPNSDAVYTGFWINRARGSVEGATLALNRQDGAFIIAFLALFVATTGRAMWKLVRCLIHFYLSSNLRFDGVYLQTQAILWNSYLAHDAAQQFLQLGYVWRRRKGHRRFSTPALSLLSTSMAAGFILAGLYSSKVSTSTANEALISGKDCGILQNIDLLSSSTVIKKRYTYEYQLTSNNLAYAMQCYRQADSERIEGCQTYTRSTLPYRYDPNTTCPFDSEMCKLSNNNVVFDTGYLDSVGDLGLNSGPKFHLRHKLHCAPLVTWDYTELWTLKSNDATRWKSYKYGSINNRTDDIFQIPLNVSVPSHYLPYDYKVYPVWNNPNVTWPKFIDQVVRPDAETSIMFLVVGEMLYYNRTADPWFSATLPTFQKSLNATFYISDDPAAPMACATTREYCNPDLPEKERCINPQSLDFQDQLVKKWPSVQDQAFLRPLFFLLSPAQVGSHTVFYSTLGLPNLLARFWIFDWGQLTALPDDHWKSEMEYMYQATLAALQSYVIEYAKGFWYRNIPICEEEGSCSRRCHVQRVKSPQHYSFSVVGLVTILVTGLIVIPSSMFLEEILNLIARIPSVRQSPKFTYAHAEWRANSTLQLQRLAHKGLGLDTWSKADETVPITEEGDALGVLDVSDNKHPRLIKPPEELKDLLRTETTKDAQDVSYSRLSNDDRTTIDDDGSRRLHGSFEWEQSAS